MRIDRLLYSLRFARSRTMAQHWIAEGHLRRNGERVTRKDLPVIVGDILTLPLNREVLVIEVLALPVRRGPASEARACYRPLDAGGAMRIAGGETPGAKIRPAAEGKAQQ